MSASRLADALRAKADALGFSTCRITNAHIDEQVGLRLAEFVAMERHGDMAWIDTTLERRRSPQSMWPEAKSAIVLTMSYRPASDPLQRLDDPGLGNISVYAQGRDYHEVIKGKLKMLAQWFAGHAATDVKVFVDTAPLMEKPLAAAAGTGWQGKHTNLVSRELGSWFFLGVILTNRPLPPDEGEQDHCGSCRACLDICPTKAFPAPYQLDARRCISYLTIEHKGHIAREFRKAMGNRIFGCDDCLAACPWNKFAIAAREIKLKAREDIAQARIADLLALDDAGFRTMFSASPVKRAGHVRFLRNLLIAAGNAGDNGLVKSVTPHLDNDSPLVRAMAAWALSQLDAARFRRERDSRLHRETDDDVQREWREAAA